MELHKIESEFSLDIKKDIFPFNKSSIYHTGNTTLFHSRPIKTVYDESRTLSHCHLKFASLFQMNLNA